MHVKHSRTFCEAASVKRISTERTSNPNGEHEHTRARWRRRTQFAWCVIVILMPKANRSKACVIFREASSLPLDPLWALWANDVVHNWWFKHLCFCTHFDLKSNFRALNDHDIKPMPQFKAQTSFGFLAPRIFWLQRIIVSKTVRKLISFFLENYSTHLCASKFMGNNFSQFEFWYYAQCEWTLNEDVRHFRGFTYYACGGMCVRSRSI